jgi:hypothetical protein
MNPNAMKKLINLVSLITTILVVVLSGPALADKYTDTIDVYKKSEAVQPFFKSAYGYAVFPTIGKGGLGIGGAYGKGQVYQAAKLPGKHPWSKCPSDGRPAARRSARLSFSRMKRAYEEFTSGELRV